MASRLKSDLHTKALLRICRRCGNVNPSHKVRSISDRIRDLYREHWNVDLSVDDPDTMPCVICNTCRMYLDLLNKGKHVSQNCLASSQENFDREINLRNRGFCSLETPCNLCQKTLEFESQTIDAKKASKRSVGRKPLQDSSSTVDLNCSSCFKSLNHTEVTSPARHKCTVVKSRVVSQVLTAIDSSSISDSDVLSATMSRNFDHETDQRSFGTVLTLPNTTGVGGPPKKVIISSPRADSSVTRVLPLRSLIGLKSISSTVSNQSLKRLNFHTDISKLSGVKFPHIERMYSDRDASIGRSFVCESVLLEDSNKDLVLKEVVVCNDISSLILNWISSDDEGEDVISLKIGIDHGQGFLKVGVQVIDKPEFSNSVSDFLLLCVAEVSESRHNLLSLLTLEPFVTFFENQRFTTMLSADIKCLQLLAGMSTGNAKFPCVFCCWQSGNDLACGTDASLRTGDEHKENLDRFQTEYRGNILNASECHNCISESYFEGQIPILYKCALPILHLTLGIVQHMYDKMTASLSEGESEAIESLLKEIGALRSPYHGHAFEGRGAHAILNNLEKFPVCVSRTSAFNTLKCYAKFLDACGGIIRKDGWPEAVNDLLISFRQTGLRPFLKIHMITHVEEYFGILDSFCPFPSPGLAWTGEQAMESSHHHHFKEVWQRYKKTPKSRNALRLAVVGFNYV